MTLAASELDMARYEASDIATLWGWFTRGGDVYYRARNFTLLYILIMLVYWHRIVTLVFNSFIAVSHSSIYTFQ
jgi:hypothetical protein